jgi:hypothetical protein
MRCTQIWASPLQTLYLDGQVGKNERNPSIKPRSTSTLSEEFDEALQSMRDIDDVKRWGETEILDSALEDTADAIQASSRRGTKTNNHFLQTAFRSAATSITATVLELPRGPHGRGGGFIKKIRLHRYLRNSFSRKTPPARTCAAYPSNAYSTGTDGVQNHVQLSSSANLQSRTRQRG